MPLQNSFFCNSKDIFEELWHRYEWCVEKVAWFFASCSLLLLLGIYFQLTHCVLSKIFYLDDSTGSEYQHLGAQRDFGAILCWQRWFLFPMQERSWPTSRTSPPQPSHRTLPGSCSLYRMFQPLATPWAEVFSRIGSWQGVADWRDEAGCILSR